MSLVRDKIGELLLLFLLAIIVPLGIGERKCEANYAQVDPEELEGHEVHDKEHCPDYWVRVKCRPENEGVCFAYGFFPVVTLVYPLFLPSFVNFTPPSEVDEETPCYIFDGPEIKCGEYDDHQKSCYFFVDEKVKK